MRWRWVSWQNWTCILGRSFWLQSWIWQWDCIGRFGSVGRLEEVMTCPSCGCGEGEAGSHSKEAKSPGLGAWSNSWGLRVKSLLLYFECKFILQSNIWVSNLFRELSLYLVLQLWYSNIIINSFICDIASIRV